MTRSRGRDRGLERSIAAVNASISQTHNQVTGHMQQMTDLVTAANLAAVNRSNSVVPGEQLPGLRLPRPYKVAFRFSELLAQQRNMSNHDAGLQVIMDVVSAFLYQLGYQHDLAEHVGTINFGTPQDMTQRTYVARFDNLNLRLSISQTPRSGRFVWEATVTRSLQRDVILTLDPAALLYVTTGEFPQDYPPAGQAERQRTRMIDLDGPNT